MDPVDYVEKQEEEGGHPQEEPVHVGILKPETQVYDNVTSGSNLKQSYPVVPS